MRKQRVAKIFCTFVRLGFARFEQLATPPRSVGLLGPRILALRLPVATARDAQLEVELAVVGANAHGAVERKGLSGELASPDMDAVGVDKQRVAVEICA